MPNLTEGITPCFNAKRQAGFGTWAALTVALVLIFVVGVIYRVEAASFEIEGSQKPGLPLSAVSINVVNVAEKQKAVGRAVTARKPKPQHERHLACLISCGEVFVSYPVSALQREVSSYWRFIWRDGWKILPAGWKPYLPAGGNNRTLAIANVVGRIADPSNLAIFFYQREFAHHNSRTVRSNELLERELCAGFRCGGHFLGIVNACSSGEVAARKTQLGYHR
jgi:hypothetical protein